MGLSDGLRIPVDWLIHREYISGVMRYRKEADMTVNSACAQLTRQDGVHMTAATALGRPSEHEGWIWIWMRTSDAVRAGIAGVLFRLPGMKTLAEGSKGAWLIQRPTPARPLPSCG